jgi:hemerythrin superfamily protein
MEGLRKRLSEDHARLRQLFDDLVNAAEGADAPTLDRVWGDFESGLLAHMDAEEKYLLGPFEQTHPEETRQILDEHARIRALVADLGVRTELHTLRKGVVDALVRELEQHSAREDRLLYRWAEQATDEETQRSLLDHLDQETERRRQRWHDERARTETNA